MDEADVAVVQRLLSTGQVSINKNCQVIEINKILNVIGYEAVVYPHSDILVLKNHNDTRYPTAPWKDTLILEAKEIFSKISRNEFINKKSAPVALLMKHNWIKEESEVKFKFTERALVQFEELIESFNGLYKKCKICTFLTTEGDYHVLCASMLNKK